VNVYRGDLRVGCLGEHEGRAAGSATQVEHSLDSKRHREQLQRAAGGLGTAGALARCVFEQLEQQTQLVIVHGVSSPPNGRLGDVNRPGFAGGVTKTRISSSR